MTFNKVNYLKKKLDPDIHNIYDMVYTKHHGIINSYSYIQLKQYNGTKLRFIF